MEQLTKAAILNFRLFRSKFLPFFTKIFRRVQVKLEDDAKRDTTMKWYSYLILLLMYIVYLGLGAYVFQRFEQPNEVLFVVSKNEQKIKRNKCIQAKNDVKAKINQFGDDYFYTLGLNLKFCRGVDEFLETQSDGVRQGLGLDASTVYILR